MRTLRSILATALAALLLLTLAACSCAGSGNVSSKTSSSSTSSTTSSSTSSSVSSSSTSSSATSSDTSSEPSDSGDTDLPIDPDDSDSGSDTSISGDTGSDDSGSDDSKVGQADPSGSLPTYEAVELTMSGLDEGALGAIPNDCHNWGPGKDVDDNRQPLECTRCNTLYEKYDAVFVLPPEKTVTLTFDLGYEAGYTASILDTLKEKNVQAVFFLTGDYLHSQPEIVQRILDEGHALGNHTVKHKNQTELSIADAAAEITALHDEVAANHHCEMTLFRPPEGAFSERSLAIAQALGYRSVFWSFAYVDWKLDAQPDPIDSLAKLENALHPGAIYLLHAVSATNDAILGSFIDSAREAGYAFCTL